MGARKHKDKGGKHRGEKDSRRSSDATETHARTPDATTPTAEPLAANSSESVIDKAEVRGKRWGSSIDLLLKVAGSLVVVISGAYAGYLHFFRSYDDVTVTVQSTTPMAFAEWRHLSGDLLNCGPIDPNVPLRHVGLVVSLRQTLHFTGASKAVANVRLTKLPDARVEPVGNCAAFMLDQKNGFTASLEMWLPTPAHAGSYEVNYRIVTPKGKTLWATQPLACFSTTSNGLIRHSATGSCSSEPWA
jgi:hypothetical protein